jgi:predicted transcriptional regulator
MPTVSIKLADETKRRLDSLAASQGIKPHALMVRAIESTLSTAEQQQSFVAAALRARQATVHAGLVVDGPAFGDYLKARVRGVNAERPSPQPIDALATKTA